MKAPVLARCCCCRVASVMSDSVRPRRRQPTRLPCPWDSPGRNTGVGCHFLRQCMQVKSESEVAQSCPTLSDPMDCSLPGSSIHGIFQARVLEWAPPPSPAKGTNSLQTDMQAQDHSPAFKDYACFIHIGKAILKFLWQSEGKRREKKRENGGTCLSQLKTFWEDWVGSAGG